MIKYVITDLKTCKNKKVVLYKDGNRIEMTDEEARQNFPSMMKAFDIMETLYNITKHNE